MARVRDGAATLRVIQDAIALASTGIPTDEALARLRVNNPNTLRESSRALRKPKTTIEVRAAALLKAAIGADGGEDLAVDKTAVERELIRLGPEGTYRELCVRIPQLLVLEDDIRVMRDTSSRAQTRHMSTAGWILRRVGKPRTAAAADHAQQTLATLHERLKPLVGPEAQSIDPLVRSPLASSWTYQHLARLLDVFPPPDFDGELR